MSQGLVLHVREDGEDIACIAMQVSGELYTMVPLMGRSLTVTEKGYIELERLLVAAAWGVRRLSNFALFLPCTFMVLSNAAMLVHLKCKKGMHHKICALLIKLSSYNCIFLNGDSAW